MTGLWEQLAANRAETSERKIVSLLEYPARFDQFAAEADGLLLDASKTNIDPAALALLIELAEAADVTEKRAAMFTGEKKIGRASCRERV